MKWAVGGLAANIVGNVALVPVFGVPGAALAFLVTGAVLLIAFYVTLPRPRPTAMGTASPVVAPAA